MPFTTTYTKTTSYAAQGGVNYFSKATGFTAVCSGNQRSIISEFIPSGTTNSGIIFPFNSGSGSFVGLSSSGPLTVAGLATATITLSGVNLTSMFAKTGYGSAGFENAEGLTLNASVANITVTNPSSTVGQTLTIEVLSDVTVGWGTQI